MSDPVSKTTNEPKIETVALAKAVDAWVSQTSWDWSSDGLEAACWAFHEHMAQRLRVAAVKAALPLEVLRMSGWQKKFTPEVQQAIDEGIAAVRCAIS